MSDASNWLPLPERWQAHCLANHCGIWLYEPGRFEQAMAAYEQDRLKAAHEDSENEADPALLIRAGKTGKIGIVRLSGSLMKGRSKFGGTSTMEARQALRAASSDDSIEGIMLWIDESPGGHASGTAELGDEIRRASAIKPMRAHADDLVASAAFWAFSQAPAGSLSINRMGEAGSIGVYAIVTDSSEAAKKAGFTHHVVKSGAQKADFAPGVPVEKEALARLQADVDRMHDTFVQAVATGREMDAKAVAKLATGRTFSAEESVAAGLVDAIMSMEDALGLLQLQIAEAKAAAASNRRRRATLAGLSIERGR